jgi:hypothetical protein
MLLLVGTGLSGCAGGDDGERLLPPARALDVRAEIAPRTLLFGDTITARVVAVVDGRRIDPDELELKTQFRPYERVGDVEIERVDIGHETELTYTVRLRCDEFACLPRGGRAVFRFQPARLGSDVVRWPAIEVGTRINESELQAFRYRATVTPVPTADYRIPPAVVAAVSLAGAVLLLGAAGLLGGRVARRLLSRRPPELDLPPLERALWLLERADGEDRRRALERLAETLEDEDRRELARASRRLAWSTEAPSGSDAAALAQRVKEERVA